MEVLLKLLDAARLARLDIKHGTVNEFTHQKLDEAIAEGEAWVNKRNEFREKIREARDKVIEALIAHVESSNCSECEAYGRCELLQEYKLIKERQAAEAGGQETKNEENGR